MALQGDDSSNEVKKNLLLLLVEELGGCRDVACIYRKCAKIFGEAFHPFDVYGVIASDSEERHWRSIPLENPKMPSWGGLAVHQLEKESDTDTLAVKHGFDISLQVLEDQLFSEALRSGHGPFEVQREASEDLANQLSFAFKVPVHSALGAGWTRPRGGRGWMFIVCREKRAFSEEVKTLFFAAVRVASRMAWYPGLIQGMLKQETLNKQLRRNIVHDLKNPLTVIKGSTETLLDHWGALDEATQKECLHTVLENTQRMLLDLQDLLLPLEDVWAPNLEVFDLAGLLQKIRRYEQYTERSQHHDIVLGGCEEPCVIRADSRKVRRIFENLLSNAVKYSPPSEGKRKTVWIDLRCLGDHVEVAIRDEGLGMDDIQLAKVMNKGGRVVDPRMGIEGTGFGLDSCRKLLEVHEGQLRGESAVGAGTTFTVVLPKEGPRAVLA